MSKKVDHTGVKGIIKGCLKGQRPAQRELYDLLFDELLITVSGFRVDKAEAEDLMQDAFIKIFSNLHTYSPVQASVYTWAKVIQKRVAINYCTSKYKQYMPTRLDDIPPDALVAYTMDDGGLDVDHLHQAIDRIPPQYGAVIRLSLLQGMRHAAVASELGISVSSSRVYLSRAVKMLQQDLKSFII